MSSCITFEKKERVKFERQISFQIIKFPYVFYFWNFLLKVNIYKGGLHFELNQGSKANYKKKIALMGYLINYYMSQKFKSRLKNEDCSHLTINLTL